MVALVGDGGLGMTMAELETSIRVGARVVVVAYDNEQYGTIRMWQERRGTGIGVGTDLGPIERTAIREVWHVVRDDGGRFLGLEAVEDD